MTSSILAPVFNYLKFYLPLIVGYAFAIYGLTLDNSWVSLSAVALGILSQIATILMLPQDS